MSQQTESSTPLLTVRGLRKSYGKAGLRATQPGSVAAGFAVDDVSFDVNVGEVVTLIGPSGCGKTTTLRSIAGLESPDSGEITLAERSLYSSGSGINVPASDRGLGMVFQSYAIWPHLSVFENVAMPLKATRRKRSLKQSEIQSRVEDVLEVTGLASYAKRPATNLSGGQQQRLALARALATRPKLMLLDEPLSNLDAKLRESMRLELSRMQRDLGLTSIYVTHDQDEALAMSTKVIVMNEGEILQEGTPQDIYYEPRSRFVAEFVGTSNILEGTVKATDGPDTVVETTMGVVYASHRPESVKIGEKVLISVRPEAITMEPVTSPPSNAPNCWEAEVVSRAFLGDVADYLVRVADIEFRTKSTATVIFDPGAHVRLSAVGDGLRVLANDGVKPVQS
jgi:iron(III) transport system ATP-binding protein